MDLSKILNVLLLAALGGLGYLYRSSREEKAKLRERLHESKRAMYEQYIDVLLSVAKESKSGKSSTVASAAQVDKLRQFAFRSPLIASDEVLRAHIRFMNIARITDRNDRSLAAIADVLIALRRDIGFPDTKMQARDILGFVVNELDQLGDKFDGWEEEKAVWDRKMGWH